MISLGAHPWADSRITGNYLNVPEGDLWNLDRWERTPFLGYVWHNGVAADWLPDSWRRLAAMGWREACLRAWYAGDSDNPCDLPAADNMVDGIFDRVNVAIVNGMDVFAVQLDNEGNLEHRTMTPAAYAARIKAAAVYFKQKFPSIPLALGALAQWEPGDPAQFDPYWAALKPVVAELADFCAVHFYFGKYAGDKEPGYKGSPEWFHKELPGKPLLITECGNATTQHDLAPLDRWLADPLIRAVFLFTLSHPGPWGDPAAPKWNPQHPMAKWCVTEQTGNWLHDYSHRWKHSRAYPAGGLVITPPPAANYDPEHLRIVRALDERIRKRVEVASAALGGIDSDAQEALDRLKMAGLQ